MMKRDEYLAQVINVYRTRHYIVFQQVGICDDAEEGTFLYSYDSYYRRTARNDREYEGVFKARYNVDGMRIPVSTYGRKYVE